MRLVFFGSGEFGLPTLGRLQERHEVVAVVTQPDRPAGRRRHLTPTAIGAWAQGKGLRVLKSDAVNGPEFLADVRSLGAEAAVVIAFGQKLSPELIRASGALAINLHGSLLPKYRGAAPINWAIINGETETGVSVIALSQRMDAGDVYAQRATPIDPAETAGQLHDRLAQLGPEVVDQVLTDFGGGRLTGQPQDERQATRAPKLTKADAWVDFDQEAFRVVQRIHGLNPWPGVRVAWRTAGGDEREVHLRRAAAVPDLSCFLALRDGARPAPGVLLEDGLVAVRDGAVRLLELQLPGGKPLSFKQFALGHPIRPGDRMSRADHWRQPG